jgi:serine/threonine protein kinase
LVSTWGVSSRIGRAVSEAEHGETMAELSGVQEEADGMKAKLSERIDPDEHRALQKHNVDLSTQRNVLQTRVSLYEKYGKVYDLDVTTREGKVRQIYQFIEDIGKGGHATVKKVRNFSAKGRIEVMKKAHEKLIKDENFRKRFFREAEVLMKQLEQSERIIDVYGYGEMEDGCPFFTMEYVRGTSLGEYLDTVGSLSLYRATDWAIEIAEGLNDMHKANIVHRDIKPENVLITQEKRPKIVDFGLARDVDIEKRLSRLTDTGVYLGTPLYMSPEQWKGDEAGQRSDLFSFGITYFEMLTGQVPYPMLESTYMAYLNRLNTEVWMKGKVPEIALRIPSIDRFGFEQALIELQNIFNQLLHPERTRRYKNAGLLVEDLMDFRINLETFEPTDHGQGPKGFGGA